ncbi:hypothetical protein KIPB_006905 [Kipferlia bialata]|uniref:Uncharacterized protein n=1 Tax=Kipferlia bialata TaxID=797122 RepID=A0A9K3CZI7_9EUKA|nr:hypothetical protein KIPB_006905 [Kipferlia bialata]|eukprot:g6905.t1
MSWLYKLDNSDGGDEFLSPRESAKLESESLLGPKKEKRKKGYKSLKQTPEESVLESEFEEPIFSPYTDYPSPSPSVPQSEYSEKEDLYSEAKHQQNRHRRHEEAAGVGREPREPHAFAKGHHRK